MNALFLICLLGSDLNMASSPRDFVMCDDMPRSALLMVELVREVHLYSPKTWYCPACEVAKKELANVPGIKLILHEQDILPDFFAGQSFPVLHWGPGDKWQSGWSGKADFLARLAESERQTSIADEAAPTPSREVERVLGLLPKPEVGFVDFGCGVDARWCVAAAERWGCKVTGIEIDHERAVAARERVRLLGLDRLVTIVEGDATKINVEADVGVAYLYGDVLEQLRPRIEKLKAFASYMHRPPGLPVTKNGDTWLYVRPTQTARAAVWHGATYTSPVCNNPRCAMCQSIRRQIYGVDFIPPAGSAWQKLIPFGR